MGLSFLSILHSYTFARIQGARGLDILEVLAVKL